MPIAARPPGADVGDVTETAPPVTDPRPGGDAIGTAAPPPDALLPSGGNRAPAPVPAPSRELALDAVRLLRCLRDPVHASARWAELVDRRDVRLVRIQLAPLQTRQALADSYGREAFHLAAEERGDRKDRDDRDDRDSRPVRVAYALRWLELGVVKDPF